MKRTFNIFSGGSPHSSSKNPNNGHGQNQGQHQHGHHGHTSIFWSGVQRPPPLQQAPGLIRSSNSTPIINNNNGSSVQSTPGATNINIFAEREGGGGMRVGKDFQAKIPPIIPKEEQNVQADADKALLIWCPPRAEQLSEDKLTQYLDESKQKYHYSGEQALGLLFWHKYDITKATQDLGNFSPHSDEWTFEDKALFEQAFQYFGKNFERMKMMLPDKSIPSLIRHYYRWKKTKSKNSVMDRTTSKRPVAMSEELEDLLPPSTSTIHSSRYPYMNNFHLNRQSTSSFQPASDSDDEITNQVGDSGKRCENCGVPCTELHSKDNMCNTCFLYWKKTGEYRPLTGPLRLEDKQTLGILRNRRAPPKGMYINHDDLCILASATPSAENVTLEGLEKEVYDLKCRLQIEKQGVEILKRELPSDGGLDNLVPKDPVTSTRVNARWTQEELLLAAQGIRRYGKDFSKVVPILGTKTEVHLRSFYANYQKRYNLDELIQAQELEAEEFVMPDLLKTQ